MPKITGLIKTGNTLLSDNDGLLKGWKVTDDGYGLQTLQATWVKDRDFNSSYFTRNLAFPIATFTDFKLHKWVISYEDLDYKKVTCDYVSINTLINGGVHTNCQVSSSNGLATENITAHPNFFEIAAGYPEVIAGTTYTESALGPTVTRDDGTKGKSYVGENGACFERSTGGRFIGFVDPTKKTLYGKTSYLAPTTQFSGIMYFKNDSAYIQKFRQMIGTSSLGRNWIGQLPDLLPEYLGGDFIATNGNYQLLMTQVNFEDYGNLVKVSYEIRFSKDGWDPKVYKTATSPS